MRTEQFVLAHTNVHLKGSANSAAENDIVSIYHEFARLVPLIAHNSCEHTPSNMVQVYFCVILYSCYNIKQANFLSTK